MCAHMCNMRLYLAVEKLRIVCEATVHFQKVAWYSASHLDTCSIVTN